MGYGFVKRNAIKAGLPKDDATTLKNTYASCKHAFRRSTVLASKHVYLGSEEREKRAKADSLFEEKQTSVRLTLCKHNEKAGAIIEKAEESSKLSSNLRKLVFAAETVAIVVLGYDIYSAIQTAAKASAARGAIIQDLLIGVAVVAVGGLIARHFRKQSEKAQDFANTVDILVPDRLEKQGKVAVEDQGEVGLSGARVARS